MEKLKDIVLKKGDKITFTDGQIDAIGWYGHNKRFEDIYANYEVTKIERPVKYETIYEAPKQTLTKEEKEWLEHFLRPFKDRVIKIEKGKAEESNQYILIRCKTSRDDIWLPSFKENKYYKGMELDKEYTLKELGLFEGE